MDPGSMFKFPASSLCRDSCCCLVCSCEKATNRRIHFTCCRLWESHPSLDPRPGSAECQGAARALGVPGGAGPGSQSPARAVPATVGGHPAGDHDFLVDSAKSNLTRNFKLYSESDSDGGPDSEIDSDIEAGLTEQLRDRRGSPIST
jgi:hypothetical protein